MNTLKTIEKSFKTTQNKSQLKKDNGAKKTQMKSNKEQKKYKEKGKTSYKNKRKEKKRKTTINNQISHRKKKRKDQKTVKKQRMRKRKRQRNRMQKIEKSRLGKAIPADKKTIFPKYFKKGQKKINGPKKWKFLNKVENPFDGSGKLRSDYRKLASRQVRQAT